MPFSTLIFEDETGLHTPTFPEVLQYYIDSTKVVYGDDVDLGPDTKDGQYISIFALSAFDMSNIAQAVYNAYSPLTAVGKALSTQAKLNGLERGVSTFSQVDLYIVGKIGTVINSGIAQDILGQQWNLPVSVVIPLSGDITVTALAQNEGSVSAAIGTINRIFKPTNGWQTVTNLVAAVDGAPVETDAFLRIRQTQSTALPALTVFESTVGLVASVDGVTRFRGYENDTYFTDTNGIPPHTISIVVDGGDDTAIAQAIWDKKTPGTGTYGTTSEVIFDEFGTPSTIRFFRPTDAVIGVNITIQALAGYVSTTEDLIKQSVSQYLNESQIGEDVYISRLYTPANLGGTPEGDTYDITILEINKNAGPFAAANIPLTFIESSVCDPDVDITVTVI